MSSIKKRVEHLEKSPSVHDKNKKIVIGREIIISPDKIISEAEYLKRKEEPNE